MAVYELIIHRQGQPTGSSKYEHFSPIPFRFPAKLPTRMVKVTGSNPGLRLIASRRISPIVNRWWEFDAKKLIPITG